MGHVVAINNSDPTKFNDSQVHDSFDLNAQVMFHPV
jgi:hypothetical protein